MTALRNLLVRETQRHGIPAASLNVSQYGRELVHETIGLARIDTERLATTDMPFDLASVTKPLVGSTIAAVLVHRGDLQLNTPVSSVLDGVDSTITLSHLLTHSAGWPAWTPFYQNLRAPWGTVEAKRELLDTARSTPLAYRPGTDSVYSDVGFLVLLDLLETVGNAPIQDQFTEHILAPTDITDLRWGWPQAAATEHCPVRKQIVEGAVHDLNTFAMGGISTHAGLFGTARGVSALCTALMEATQGKRPTLPGSTLADFWHHRGPGTHVHGWDTITRSAPTSASHRFPPDTIGHLGYTGTSVWVSPSHGSVVTLLTNRVHPTDDKTGIQALRPIIHEAIADMMNWTETTCEP